MGRIEAVNTIRSIWNSSAAGTTAGANAAAQALIDNNIRTSTEIYSLLLEAGVPWYHIQPIFNAYNALGGVGGTPITTKMKVFSQFGADDVVNNLTRRVTEGLWTGNTGSLELFYTSSDQTGTPGDGGTGDWYYNVYNADPTGSAEVQFAVSYGQRFGGGFPSIAVLNTSKEPTKATYAQYRNILLDPEDTTFTFGGVNSDAIYVINIQRDRLKQKMDAGNWELHLSDGVDTIKLIDDSGQKFDQTTSVAGRKYKVVSGSLNIGSTTDLYPHSQPSGGGYGLFYPDRGLIILNPSAVTASLPNLAATYVTTSNTLTYANNHGDFFNVIAGGGNFTARNEDIVTSTHYFVRVKNRDYNLSNNPTYYTSSDGSLKVPTFVGDPHAYMTTIGLYNGNNELLAVAKLSQPILKSFDRESLVKVKLDF